MVLTGVAVLMIGLGADRAVVGCPPEFVATCAGFCSLTVGIAALVTGAKVMACWFARPLFGAGAEGATEVVIGAGAGASFFEGRVGTTRCGATVFCGVAGGAAAGVAGKYELNAVGCGVGVSLSLSGVVLGLY
jgi:hypothetical protein